MWYNRKMKILENIALKNLTTMRLGGPAKYVLEVESKSDIPAAFNFARKKNLPFFILGGGANTIAHDEGFDGVIVRNTMDGVTLSMAGDGRRGTPKTFYDSKTFGGRGRQDPPEITAEDSGRQDPPEVLLTVMGGTDWDAAVAFACEQNLTGIEALSKIPGKAGAAPVQNIGAYGQDISQVFVSAEVYDTKTNEFKTLSASDFHFSYRHSIMNTTEKNRYFVISITLKLQKGEMPRPFYNSIERFIAAKNITDFSPKSIRKIVSEIRNDKLPDPLEKASSGSFFKNIYLTEKEAKAAEEKGYPVYKGHDGLKINSAWLIENAGLKGALLHGMRVSNSAPLVLINESASSYQDLAAARAEIIAAVKAKFGYTLEQEPVEINVTGDNQKIITQNRGRKNPPTKILNGSELAGFIKERQAHQAKNILKNPTLLIIRDNPSPVIDKYVYLKTRYGHDIGVNVIDFVAKSTAEIKAKILAANQDKNIHAIILQLPILDKSKTDELTNLITPAKDVDGLGKNSEFDSATATAILWLLAGYDIDLKNQKIAIVGRGKLVGAPLFKMLTNSGNDVTLFHHGDDLTKLKNHNVIITATGVPGLITSDMVSPGTVIVDAGTASEDGIIKGDVADEVRARTDLAAITPILGGVGPLTISCLFDHVLTAASK